MRRRTINRNRVRRLRMYQADKRWADAMENIAPDQWAAPPRRWKARLIKTPEGL